MGHKVLVTNQPEAEAMEYAKKLSINDITYGALPHLFGDIPLPFVYDEDEVDFARNNNPVHRYKIVSRMIPIQVPILIPQDFFNEQTGVWEVRKVQKTELVPEKRYRLLNPEKGKASKVETYQVMVKQPVFEEREVPIEEIVEEEVPI